MKIIECPKCSEKVTSDTKFCLNCGELIPEELFKDQRKSNKRIIIWVLVGIIVISAMVGGFYWQITTKENNLAMAYNNGEYEHVVDLYNNDGFKYSEEAKVMAQKSEIEVATTKRLEKAQQLFSIGEYKLALGTMAGINSDYSRFSEVKQLRQDICPPYAEELLELAKQAYENEDYEEAYKKILSSTKMYSIEEAEDLKEVYSKKRDEYRSVKMAEDKKIADQKAKDDEKARLEAIRKNMALYTNSYGDVKISVGKVKETNSTSDGYTTYTAGNNGTFVWVFIAAKNFGGDVEHVNPNDFTLTSEGGNTVNYDTVSYHYDYFDAIDLNKNNSTSGWLIFYTTKSDAYTLNYNGFSSSAVKEIIN